MAPQFTHHQPQGFVALVSALVVSLILTTIAFSLSSSGYFARFGSQVAEYKRVSLGLAESCVNVALLRIGQNYSYSVGTGDIVNVNDQTCTIESVDTGTHRTIVASASYRGAFSTIQVKVTVQDPSVTYLSAPSISMGSWQEAAGSP